MSLLFIFVLASLEAAEGGGVRVSFFFCLGELRGTTWGFLAEHVGWDLCQLMVRVSEPEQATYMLGP